MTPEQLVGCVDFRYITDALTPEQALELLDERAAGKRRARSRDARATASPPTRPRRAGSATPTRRSAGCCREAVADGLDDVKMKVGANSTDDVRRAAIIREEIGPSAS